MQRCSICQQDADKAPIGGLTHLSLFINGSEGVQVCYACRLVLSNLVSSMALMTVRAMKTQRLLTSGKEKQS
jgi:hypothetical protein